MNNTQLSPYLNFNGDCEQAMKFYQSVLGGELEINRFADFASPDIALAESQKDKIMHASLINGALTFMASDGAPNREVNFGNSVSISIAGQDEAELTNFLSGLSQGGTVTMPLAKQIWGDSFGMLTDKFGIHWMINIGTGTAKT